MASLFASKCWKEPFSSCAANRSPKTPFPSHFGCWLLAVGGRPKIGQGVREYLNHVPVFFLSHSDHVFLGISLELVLSDHSPSKPTYAFALPIMDEVLRQLVDKAWSAFLETPKDTRFCEFSQTPIHQSMFKFVRVYGGCGCSTPESPNSLPCPSSNTPSQSHSPRLSTANICSVQQLF